MEAKCWTKYPHLKPAGKGLVVRTKKTSVPIDLDSDTDSEDHVCLMASLTSSPSQTDKTVEQDSWVIDSEATAHMSYNRESFIHFEVIPSFDVSMGDKSNVQACGCGSVKIQLSVDNKTLSCTVKDVLFVPDLSYNLIPVSAIDKLGLSVTYQGGVA